MRVRYFPLFDSHGIRASSTGLNCEITPFFSKLFLRISLLLIQISVLKFSNFCEFLCGISQHHNNHPKSFPYSSMAEITGENSNSGDNNVSNNNEPFYISNSNQTMNKLVVISLNSSNFVS